MFFYLYVKLSRISNLILNLTMEAYTFANVWKRLVNSGSSAHNVSLLFPSVPIRTPLSTSTDQERIQPRAILSSGRVTTTAGQTEAAASSGGGISPMDHVVIRALVALMT